MTDRLRVDVFCEDRAHEELIGGLLERICARQQVEVDLAIRSARGGHGKALHEFRLYQDVVRAHGLPYPDVLVVAIDTNCRSYHEVVTEIESHIDHTSFPHYALACPNPHIELWYMADATAFEQVVGIKPPKLARECGKASRNTLKRALAECIKAAGHPLLFGGIQFARELAEVMDPFRAGKVDAGLRHFIRDVANALRRLRSAQDPDGPSSPPPR